LIACGISVMPDEGMVAMRRLPDGGFGKQKITEGDATYNSIGSDDGGFNRSSRH
jgi:hypothetical protein